MAVSKLLKAFPGGTAIRSDEKLQAKILANFF